MEISCAVPAEEINMIIDADAHVEDFEAIFSLDAIKRCS